MDIKDILLVIGGGLSSPVLLKLLEYLKARRQDGESESRHTSADKSEFIRILMDEMKILKACAEELQEENLRLERRLYRLKTTHRNTKGY